jgi:hypothetical protein
VFRCSVSAPPPSVSLVLRCSVSAPPSSVSLMLFCAPTAVAYSCWSTPPICFGANLVDVLLFYLQPDKVSIALSPYAPPTSFRLVPVSLTSLLPSPKFLLPNLTCEMYSTKQLARCVAPTPYARERCCLCTSPSLLCSSP